MLSGVGDSRLLIFRLSSTLGRYGVDMSSYSTEISQRLAKVRRRYTPIFYSYHMQQVRMRDREASVEI
jgi:hypothetical protein